MYKEGSKIWYVHDLLKSMGAEQSIFLYFEKDKCTCYMHSIDGEHCSRVEIPFWYAMGKQVFRNTVNKISDEMGYIVRTYSRSDDSKFMQVVRIK